MTFDDKVIMNELEKALFYFIAKDPRYAHEYQLGGYVESEE